LVMNLQKKMEELRESYELCCLREKRTEWEWNRSLGQICDTGDKFNVLYYTFSCRKFILFKCSILKKMISNGDSTKDMLGYILFFYRT
jgi:hypothetical protein